MEILALENRYYRWSGPWNRDTEFRGDSIKRKKKRGGPHSGGAKLKIRAKKRGGGAKRSKCFSLLKMTEEKREAGEGTWVQESYLKEKNGCRALKKEESKTSRFL